MRALLAVVIVAIGGGLGSAARFTMAGAIDARRSGRLPWGTMSVNLLGSFIIGVVTALVTRAQPSDAAVGWQLALATGFCGGFTTFSTATVESLLLAKDGELGSALASVLATLAGTITAVALGYGLVALLG